MLRQAARISVNRVVAGVHFPIDNSVGQVLGTTLARYFMVLASGSGGDLQAWKFKGNKYGNRDFPWKETDRGLDPDRSAGPALPPYLNRRAQDITLQADPAQTPLNWLWTKARAEWS
jgi:hypothetical protein